jgi:hypothetical protein
LLDILVFTKSGPLWLAAKEAMNVKSLLCAAVSLSPMKMGRRKILEKLNHLVLHF